MTWETLALMAALAGAPPPVEVTEPEPKRIEWGYNAAQMGATSDGPPRGRLYTDATVNLGRAKIFVSSMNEAGPDTFYGWNTGGVGLRDFPVSAIYTTRIANDGGSIVKLDEAIGARIDLQGLPGIHYGRLDLLRNLGGGLDGYDGKELALFVGREFGDNALEALVQLGESDREFAEFEFLGPATGAGLKIRPFARLEAPDFEYGTIIVGLQAQR